MAATVRNTAISRYYHVFRTDTGSKYCWEVTEAWTNEAVAFSTSEKEARAVARALYAELVARAIARYETK